jgi:hypothetical protein
MKYNTVQIIFYLFIAFSAAAQQMSDKYFKYIDIDENTEKFTLKEGELLRVWDDRIQKNELYRYAALYKIYLGEQTIAVDLISDNVIGLISLFPGCLTNFSIILTGKAESSGFWVLKEIKKPKIKGKTELIFLLNIPKSNE